MNTLISLNFGQFHPYEIRSRSTEDAHISSLQEYSFIAGIRHSRTRSNAGVFPARPPLFSLTEDAYRQMKMRKYIAKILGGDQPWYQ